MFTEFATSVPSEVTSSLSLNTVVTLAIISAICSAIALILNTIIPLITQHIANKHALQMAKIEQWEKVKFEAYQQLVTGAEIFVSFKNIPKTAISNACMGIARIMPYLDEDDLKRANLLLSQLELLEENPVSFSSITRDYSKLLNTVAKKFEEPNISRKALKTKIPKQESKDIVSLPQSKQKIQSKG